MAKPKREILDVRTDIIGRPGGIARANKLSAARRSEIARLAANARWKTKKVRIQIK